MDKISTCPVKQLAKKSTSPSRKYHLSFLTIGKQGHSAGGTSSVELNWSFPDRTGPILSPGIGGRRLIYIGQRVIWDTAEKTAAVGTKWLHSCPLVSRLETTVEHKHRDHGMTTDLYFRHSNSKKKC